MKILKILKHFIIKHTYIIGHYNPSVRIIDLVSQTSYVVCVNFISSGGTYSLKSPPKDRFFKKLFMAFNQSQNFLLFNFCEQKFVQHGSITIAIDCNGLSLLIFEEKWPNYASGPKSTRNSDSFWVRRLFNACVPVFCASNATILLVYIPAKIKTRFI